MSTNQTTVYDLINNTDLQSISYNDIEYNSKINNSPLNDFQKYFNYYDVFQEIYRFIETEIIHKYDLISCYMQVSEEIGIEMEYIFKVPEKIQSIDLYYLSLNINKEIYKFCKKHNIKSVFNQTLIILNR